MNSYVRERFLLFTTLLLPVFTEVLMSALLDMTTFSSSGGHWSGGDAVGDGWDDAGCGEVGWGCSAALHDGVLDEPFSDEVNDVGDEAGCEDANSGAVGSATGTDDAGSDD